MTLGNLARKAVSPVLFGGAFVSHNDLSNLTTSGACMAGAAEIKTMQDWAKKAFAPRHDSSSGLLDGSRFPFSFKVGKTSSADWFVALNPETSSRSGSGFTETESVWFDKSTGLKVTVLFKVFDRYPAVDWVLWFENVGSVDTPILSDIQALDLVADLQAGEKAIMVHRLTGDDCDETSFRPVKHSVRSGRSARFACAEGRSSQRTAFPFFDVAGESSGLTIAVGWSGQWAASVQRDENGQTRLCAGLEKTHFRLHPGEKVRSPRMLVMRWDGDLTCAHNRWRRLLIDHYVPRLNDTPANPPLASQCFDRYSWTAPEWATEKGQIQAAEASAKLGCNTHWFDAAWFPGGFPDGVGNWTCKPEAFPNGLKPVSDRCHQLGLNFLLWFEPERVADGTQIEREHPEWVSGNLFRLDLREACEWLTDLLDQRITEFGLDWYRQDFNMDPLAVWVALDASDRVGMSETLFIQNLYWMWDELVRRHPGLMIDDCASGGRRIDLEMIMRSHPLWRSDTGCAPGHADLAQSQTMTLSSYLPVTSICSWLPCAYEMRSSATMGLAVQFDYLSPTFAWEEGQAAVAEVRENAPYFWGDFYPLTGSSTSLEEFVAFQFHRGDLSAGIILAFRRAQCQVVGIEVVPHGIDPSATYRVEIIDEDRNSVIRTILGSELLAGVQLRIPTSNASLLWRYQKL
jgi:alpha-galactosidase